MTDPISPEDRALIEHTRKVNKTLSLFVFALQERRNSPAESLVDIADMLDALADTIRNRASQQRTDSVGKVLTITAPTPLCSSDPTTHPCRHFSVSR